MANVERSIPQTHLDIFEDTAFNAGVEISKYEQGLQDRLSVEEQLAEAYRSTNQNLWSFESGDYRDSFHGINAPLQGLEREWEFSMNELKGTPRNPLVALDIGGGFALSLIRLGRIQRFKKRIDEGDLILATTNLGYLPPTESDDDGYTGVASSMNQLSKSGDNTPRTEEELEFVQKHQDNVQFLDSSLLDLPHQLVKTRSGSKMPLHSNVGLVSERLALVHSHVPEVGIGAISDLLVPGGHLYLHTTNPRAMEPTNALKQATMPDGRVIDMQHGYAYYEQRKQALQIGLASAARLRLQHFGDPASAPAFFKKL